MRSFAAGIGGIVVGVVVTVMGVYAITSRGNRDVSRVPELGGQPVPEQLIEIEFDQRYDVHTSVYGVEPMTLTNCKIMGFTGRKGTAQSQSSGSSGLSSSLKHFDHWLVLEQADGRLLYLPADSVRYIEQTTASKK